MAVDEKTIEVEATDGKKLTAALSAETKYLRDGTPVTRDDVKVGERVVIVVVGDKAKTQNVKQVLVGASSARVHEH